MKRGFGRRENCVGVMGSWRKRKGVAVLGEKEKEPTCMLCYTREELKRQ
jgi:hypothetical protein